MEMNDANVAEKKVFGVLTDYDLSSWTASLTLDYTKTSQQRTGTPPFMARGLLNGTEAIHLYRHDVESLFYIILILATHYEIQAPEKGKDGGIRMRQGLTKLPYQAWFDQPSYETLSAHKEAFFSMNTVLDLSPAFKDFGDWLEDIRLSFRQGIRSRQVYDDALRSLRRQRGGASGGGVIPTFDDETLAGEVHYFTLIDPVGNLTGKLEGLVIRYAPSPPASTGA